MKFLDFLERKFGRFYIPNITIVLIIGQSICCGLSKLQVMDIQDIVLVPQWAVQGEYWRLVTFVFIPPFESLLFSAFAWYMFYLMGSALEQQWGEFRYNIFLFIGYIATVAAAFVHPSLPASNVYLGGSVFLAFAALYPDFMIYLFLILPVKVKWMAVVTWIGYFLQFVMGSWSVRLMIAASVCNFFLFFGQEVAQKIRYARRKMASQAERLMEQGTVRHRCSVCGKNSRDQPAMDFRYCSECDPVRCFCGEHIGGHEHVTVKRF